MAHLSGLLTSLFDKFAGSLERSLNSIVIA
jgi:hypothetical protein